MEVTEVFPASEDAANAVWDLLDRCGPNGNQRVKNRHGLSTNNGADRLTTTGDEPWLLSSDNFVIRASQESCHA
jgi:hypothetical protein